MITTDKEHISVTHAITLIDAARQSFDMAEIQNRRFMYNPATDALILGYQYEESKHIISSHAEEHGLCDTNEPFDAFLRGWVGTGSYYPDGVIHFTPPIPKDNAPMFDQACSTLEMFRENGANGGTVVRGFPGAWEQALSGILPAKEERKVPMERDLDELHATVDKACAILQRTHDGDDLDPHDLSLTTGAVNEHLTELGQKKFDELYRRVFAGEYKKPWLHDVEPMTRDHEGYIYYKDNQVEHYSKPYVHSLQAARDLLELRNRCAYLERHGEEISCGSAIWGWEKYAGDYSREKQTELDRALGEGGGLTFSKVVIDNNWNGEIKFFTPGAPDWDAIRAGPEFQDFDNRNDSEHGWEVSIQSYRYGGTRDADNAEAMDAIPSCFDHLNESGALTKVHSQIFNVKSEREDEADAGQDDEAEWGDDD